MENNVVYTLIYDDNGGSLGPGVKTKDGNESYAIFEAVDQTPTRPGFVFSGWSFSPDGEALIQAGDLFTVTSTQTTLYAVWTEAETEEGVIENATDGNTEPLGVFTSSESNDSQIQIVGDSIGFAFIGASIVLGLIALVLFRAKKSA